MSDATDTRSVRDRLPEILAAHRKWVLGKEGCGRANLRDANLHGAYLRDADLRDANLHGADLRGADLRGANLRGADLHGANLRGADLHGANLHGAYLRGADLRGANLRGADLHGANLHGAYLRDADLRDADLRGADLHGANLHGAYLHGAAGVVHLTETDHGYIVLATWRDEQVRIIAGCRDFTIDEAKSHWGASDYHTPRSGRRVVAVLEWLEREIKDGFDLSVGAR